MDRLPHAKQYKAQEFWPLPCIAKVAAIKWTHLQTKPLNVYQMHDAWPPKADVNIALICGRRAGLLVLNINVKNGHDGHATLQRLGLTSGDIQTPTIRTPSGGLALCFKVPAPELYPGPFHTYVHPAGYDGLEFRGGNDHYQLVPPSRTPEGRYTFLPPWALERLRADLVDLPEAILQAWIALDHRYSPTNFCRDDHANIGKPRKPLSAKGNAGHLTSALTLPKPFRSRSYKPTPTALPANAPRNNKQELLKTGARVDITTVLSVENGKRFRDTFAYGCALHLVRLLGQPGAWLESKHTFSCVLPGHRESSPSARWVWQRDGSLLYHDMHVRSDDRVYWAVPEVFAAFITGTLAKFRDPSMKTWSIRLAVEAGLTEPYPIPKPVIPSDAPPLVRTVAAGVWLVFAVKWTYEAEKALMLAQAFLGGWCGGIPAGSVWFALKWLTARRLLMSYRDNERRTVYLPGREWPL